MIAEGRVGPSAGSSVSLQAHDRFETYQFDT